MSLPTTRREALSAGVSHYFTGRPCKQGHIRKRQATDGSCVECTRLRAARRYARAPEAYAEASRKWRLKNPAYVERNRERICANGEAYRRRHPELHAARRALQRARKLAATPAWAGPHDRAVEMRLRALGKVMAEVTGERWEVDHIVPLAGQTVCGLHVAANLQVIPMTANRRKSNIFLGKEGA